MGQIGSKQETTPSSQPPPADWTMNTPPKLTPDDRKTFELLLQMGYSAQDALQQMTQLTVVTPSVEGNTEASNTTSTTAASSTVPQMVQEGSQGPPSTSVKTEKSDEEETRSQPRPPPPPPPAFSDSTPYNLIALSVRPTLGMLWKHYNPTGPFNAQGFCQLNTEDGIDITDIEMATIAHCNLEGQAAYVLSYGDLGDDPGICIDSTQVHFPDELIKSAKDVVVDLTDEDITTNGDSNGAMNGTPTTNATCEEQVPQDGTGQRLSGQKRKSQTQGTRTPPPRQRGSSTPPEHRLQRTHTPSERRSQTASRTLEKIRKRPTPTKLVRSYSIGLWNKWKANYEPDRTDTQHLEKFYKYVVYEMIKGRFGNKLKILYELLYRYQDHYGIVIYEDNIRKIKQRLIGHCKSWREQHERFMFIPNAVDPIPQYLGCLLREL